MPANSTPSSPTNGTTDEHRWTLMGRSRSLPLSAFIRVHRWFPTALMAQEVEVAAFVGLEDVPLVEPGVAAVVVGGGRLPLRAAGGEFLVGDQQLQAAGGRVQVDRITVPDQRQWAADGALRRDVEDHGPEGGAAHPAVRDADHVADALGQQFLRD